MLDVIGALVLGAIGMAFLVVLIGLAAIRPASKFVAFAIAAIWFSLIVMIAAAGGFVGPGITGPFPAPVAAFLILVIAGAAAWLAWPDFRRAVLSVPLVALVGINGVRVAGVFFLILHAQGRLAAPFSTSAGWGDIIVGAIAIPLAALMIGKGTVSRWLLGSWNALGILDLITAIALGALSAPGTPFRVFTEAPSTVAMGTLPWVMIPTTLVPLFLLTHLTIAARLRASYTEEVKADRRSSGLAPDAAVRRVA
jgi:hypothetical protein